MKIVEIIIKSALAVAISYVLSHLIWAEPNFFRTWGDAAAMFAGFVIGNGIYEYLIKK